MSLLFSLAPLALLSLTIHDTSSRGKRKCLTKKDFVMLSMVVCHHFIPLLGFILISLALVTNVTSLEIT
uniref:NADH dehydrogenase subunit 4 n=1 Tax=Picea glauca TaxID=3330 RepID=A0A117NIK6_PICGL|nr:hypothetical protein ABT39_MTgene3346 [Picea glauca]